ncbi:head-tail connector protein [Pararhodobacter oceanensis]|uniref:head-tail connector protein n=1 Tax=Pararhodobacter oceanensis TaxID=2172121 RepID=UPI003A8CBAD8
MHLIERTPSGTADPVTAAELADHMRIELAEATSAMRFARAAADEIEAYARIALLSQEIVAISEPCPSTPLCLPVGPVAADASVTVELLEVDGSLTPVPDGWHLEAGLYPKLHFDQIPGGRLKITYAAGYGASSADIPDDLSHAILDHALRLYDRRGDTDAPATMAPATARICARYRRVMVGA